MSTNKVLYFSKIPAYKLTVKIGGVKKVFQAENGRIEVEPEDEAAFDAFIKNRFDIRHVVRKLSEVSDGEIARAAEEHRKRTGPVAHKGAVTSANPTVERMRTQDLAARLGATDTPPAQVENPGGKGLKRLLFTPPASTKA